MKIVQIEINEEDTIALTRVVKGIFVAFDALPTNGSEGLKDAIIQHEVVEWVKCLQARVQSHRQTKAMFDEIMGSMSEEVMDKMGSDNMETRSKAFDEFMSSLDPNKIMDIVNSKINKEVH
jgi:hypothetical protein